MSLLLQTRGKPLLLLLQICLSGATRFVCLGYVRALHFEVQGSERLRFDAGEKKRVSSL